MTSFSFTSGYLRNRVLPIRSRFCYCTELEATRTLFCPWERSCGLVPRFSDYVAKVSKTACLHRFDDSPRLALRTSNPGQKNSHNLSMLPLRDTISAEDVCLLWAILMVQIWRPV